MTLAGSVHALRNVHQQQTNSTDTLGASMCDLDAALERLAAADQARAEAAVLLGRVLDNDLAKWFGYVSAERLVAHRTGSTSQTARSLMRVARFLEHFPATAAALVQGRITWASAETLAQAAADRYEFYRRDEHDVLDAVEGQEPDRVEEICQLWRARVDPEATQTQHERIHANRGVWMQHTLDGACTGRFTLGAIEGEAVWAALDTKPDPNDTLPAPRTPAQRRADQLVDVCQQALNPDRGCSGHVVPLEPDGKAGPGRSTVDVVIDIHTLAGEDAPLDQIRAELKHGGPLTGPGLERILCDASFRALIADGPHIVLAYNQATPDIPPALRRAIRIRDRCCIIPGCDRPWYWCDAHHLIPRHKGGPTNEDNLGLLCRFHHVSVHEGGWLLIRGPDGTITYQSP